MSYKIIMSKQQLQIITAALNNAPDWEDTDEHGDNALDVLRDLSQTTLECEEDDTLHGWIA